MSTEVNLIDFENGDVNQGDTICIHDHLSNSWKTVTAQEIDLTEREILVQFDNGSQEWIRMDGRKFCLPPIPETPSVPAKRSSSSRKRSSGSRSSRRSRDKSKKSKGNAEKDNATVNEEDFELVVKEAHEDETESKELDPKNETQKGGSKVFAAISFPKVKLKTVSRFEMMRRRRERQEMFRKKKQLPVTTHTEDIPAAPTPAPPPPAQPIPDTPSKRAAATASRQVTKVINKKSRSGGEIPKIRIKFAKLPPLSITPSAKGKPKAEELVGTPEKDLTVGAVTPDASLIIGTPIASVPVNVSSLSLTAGGTSGYICPKQDCKKQFRNENLLMMHIKHYHREYRNMLSSMPNVADFAYARTVGQSIDTPQSGFLEKIVKLEEDRMKENDEVTKSGEENVPPSDRPGPSSLQKLLETDFTKILKNSKKTTPVKKGTPSMPSSPSSSVLLAQLKQPPLVPPAISIQSEGHTDAEISITQNNPVTLLSPKVSDRLLDRTIGKASPLREPEDRLGGKKSSIAKKRKLSQMEDYEVTNCVCGYGYEDGLMMQCDLCLCWQHATCNSVENPEDTPSDYICYTCQHPRRQHSSKKYSYVQNWLQDGKLPRFEFTKTDEKEMEKKKEFLKQTHELLSSLADLKNTVRSLQVKVHILGQTADHPKLYLWALSWNEKKTKEAESAKAPESGGPVPEVAINMADCRKHLEEHIDDEMVKVDLILDNLEEKINKLDANDDFGNDPDKYRSAAKQTLLMLTRDLASLQNMKYT